MTNAEISRWLAGLKNDIGQSQYQPLWHYAEALDMAIAALSVSNDKKTMIIAVMEKGETRENDKTN